MQIVKVITMTNFISKIVENKRADLSDQGICLNYKRRCVAGITLIESQRC